MGLLRAFLSNGGVEKGRERETIKNDGHTSRGGEE